jgi:hypothetical protein
MNLGRHVTSVVFQFRFRMHKKYPHGRILKQMYDCMFLEGWKPQKVFQTFENVSHMFTYIATF